MDYDPYQIADSLARMSVDLGSDSSSLTSTDVSAALLHASRIIEDIADTANHYRMRNRVVVIANGEEIEIDDDIAGSLISEAVQSIVTEALEMYVTAAKVVPGFIKNT
jgi:hypothetical protein